MTNQAELRALLDQVVNAEGPLSSDTLDALTRATFGKAATFDDWGVLNDAINKGDMNAALAFKERVLPGWEVTLREYKEPDEYGQEGDWRSSASVNPAGDQGWVFEEEHGTPALALAAAVLTALIEQEGE